MKSKVIIIYGAIGVGKLTIARLLAEKTGFLLSHNHLVNDLAYSLFERGTLEVNELSESIRYMVYEKAIQVDKSFIITHTYSHDYVSLTGQTDPEYLRNLQKRITSKGGEAYFIHLQADDKTLLERVAQEDRKQFRKLVDTKIMQELIDTKDFKSSAEVDNQLILDSSGLTSIETVEKVFNFISNI